MMSIAPIISSNTSKTTIKIGFLLQSYDWMDTGVKFILFQYKRCLRAGERRYNVNFELKILMDDLNGGDVHNGALENGDYDIILAPGGYGSWYTSETYRENIRNFISKGGGYYGICGDSTFGGFTPDLSDGYKEMMGKFFDLKDVTEMLEVVNVCSNMSVFEEMIGDPNNISKTTIWKLLFGLATSRAYIKFIPGIYSIQEPFYNKNVRIMLGNVPLIDAGKNNMPDVVDVGLFDGYDYPYPRSIVGQKAIVSTTYGDGRVVLSAPHPELTFGNKNAHHVFVRNLLWAANAK